MADPSRTLTPGDPQDRWISITRRALGGSFGLLLGAAALIVLAGEAKPLGAIVLALVAVVGGAAWLHRRAVAAQDRSRRTEAEAFARILQGLSRSISPAAIVEAMLGDLGRVAEADHCVVVRLEPGSNAPIATLVSMRPGVPSTTTFLPLATFGGADDDQDQITERLGLAARGGLRDRQHPERAAPPRGSGDRRDHPVTPVPRALAAGDPADPGRRRARGLGGPQPRGLESGR